MSLPTPYFQDEWCTVYCGDCRSILPELPKVDLVLTDPPYGCGRSSGVGQYGREKWESGDLRWDDATPDELTLELIRNAGERAIVWGGNYFRLPLSRKFLVWDKGAGFKNRDFAECEMAWCSWDGNAQVFTRDPLAGGDYKGKQHPTQKPLPLILWCLQIVPGAASILDPFMGSGTTLVAAKRLGRKAIGVEIEPRYCEIAVRRIQEASMPLLEHLPEQTTLPWSEPGPRHSEEWGKLSSPGQDQC